MPTFPSTPLPGCPAGRTVTVRKRPGGAPIETTPSTLTTTADTLPGFATTDPQTYAYAAVQGFSTVLVRPTEAPADAPTGSARIAVATVGDRGSRFPSVAPTGVLGEDAFANAFTGTSAVDSATFKSGSGALRSTAPVGTGAFGARAALPQAQNWSGDSLLLTLRSDDWASVTDGYLIAWGAGTESTYQIRPHIGSLANNEWYDVPVSLAQFGGTVDWAAVTNLLLQWFSPEGKQPQVWVDRVLRVPRPARAVVSLTFDDGFATVDTIARPHLDRYAMRAGVAVMPAAIGGPGYATEAQIARCADSGWDIQGHGVDALTTLTEAAMAADVQRTRDWLAARNYKGADVYVYPLGQQNAAVRRTVAQHFRHGRGTLSTSQTAYTTDAFNSTARQVGQAIALATAQGWVDAAIANGEWLNLVFHELRSPTQTAEDWTPADFRALIDYIASTGVTVAPTSEVLASARTYRPEV